MKKYLLILLVAAGCLIQSNLYADYKVHMSDPPGWTREYSADPKVRKFVKHQLTPGEIGPILKIITDIVKDRQPAIATPLDYAKHNFNIVSTSIEGIKIQEEPTPLTINGKESAEFLYDYSVKTAQGETWIRTKMVFFKHWDLVTTFMIMDKRDDFDKTLADCDISLKTYDLEKISFPFEKEHPLVPRKEGGTVQRNLYEQDDPSFRVSIPQGLGRDWFFSKQPNPAAPFTIVLPTTAHDRLPFISFMIVRVREKFPSKKPFQLFRSMVEDKQIWEKQYLPDLKIIKKPESFSINGNPAYQRVFESPSLKTTYHFVNILVADQVLEFGLNSKTEDFEQNQKDFIAIINTLSKK